MRGALVLGIAMILVVASLGAGYELGNATSHTETTTSTVVSSTTLTVVSTATGKFIGQNGTYTGPGCPPPAVLLMALRIPCIHYTNSSAWSDPLVLYNGKDFLAANETVAPKSNPTNSTTYTVWFDNSTAYCVSPYLSVSELPTCPPP
jgi:hypothetical protein